MKERKLGEIRKIAVKVEGIRGNKGKVRRNEEGKVG